jgi:hypothetical protein
MTTRYSAMTPAQKDAARARNRRSHAKRRAEARTRQPAKASEVKPRQHYAKKPMRQADKALPGVLRVVRQVYEAETDPIKRAELEALNPGLFE